MLYMPELLLLNLAGRVQCYLSKDACACCRVVSALMRALFEAPVDLILQALIGALVKLSCKGTIYMHLFMSPEQCLGILLESRASQCAHDHGRNL